MMLVLTPPQEHPVFEGTSANWAPSMLSPKLNPSLSGPRFMTWDNLLTFATFATVPTQCPTQSPEWRLGQPSHTGNPWHQDSLTGQREAPYGD